jgi:hypothetical protein
MSKKGLYPTHSTKNKYGFSFMKNHIVKDLDIFRVKYYFYLFLFAVILNNFYPVTILLILSFYYLLYRISVLFYLKICSGGILNSFSRAPSAKK